MPQKSPPLSSPPLPIPRVPSVKAPRSTAWCALARTSWRVQKEKPRVYARRRRESESTISQFSSRRRRLNSFAQPYTRRSRSTEVNILFFNGGVHCTVAGRNATTTDVDTRCSKNIRERERERERDSERERGKKTESMVDMPRVRVRVERYGSPHPDRVSSSRPLAHPPIAMVIRSNSFFIRSIPPPPLVLKPLVYGYLPLPVRWS